jgi:hypothetical protein
MLLDLRTLDWDHELLEMFTIPRALMPSIRPSTRARHRNHFESAVFESKFDSCGNRLGGLCFEKKDSVCNNRPSPGEHEDVASVAAARISGRVLK